jgi:hypothetical protein
VVPGRIRYKIPLDRGYSVIILLFLKRDSYLVRREETKDSKKGCDLKK